MIQTKTGADEGKKGEGQSGSLKVKVKTVIQPKSGGDDEEKKGEGQSGSLKVKVTSVIQPNTGDS